MITKFNKYLNEGLIDKMTPKSEEDIEKDWDDKKYGMSYTTFKKTKDDLEGLGVDVKNVSYSRPGFVIEGYNIFRSNWGLGKALTEEDAKFLVDSFNKIKYEPYLDVTYSKDRITIDLQEARYYIANKRFNFKKYPIEGKHRRI